MAHDPAIAGLEKMGSIGSQILFGNAPTGSGFGGPTYECPAPGGSSVFCPGVTGGSYSDSFTIPAHWETHTGSGVFADDFYPPPDLVLVEAAVRWEFSIATDGCGVDSGGDPLLCGPALSGSADISVDCTAGTPDFQPFPGFAADPWDPARDPSYVSGGWIQGGAALIAPPTPVYTDPDPLDPNIDYAPYLWRWRDVIGQRVDVSVTASSVHSGAPAVSGVLWALTVTPYQYITPPVTSPTGTVYWL